jgi:hypothetical protein
MWDGTDPVDSVRLAKGLARSFRCINLLDDSPSGEFGVMNSPRIFQPCGSAGTDITDTLFVRGLFEFPQTFFDPVHNNSGDDRPAILQFSGHGIPGFMFSESGVLIAMSRAMRRTSSSPGTTWNFVNTTWNNPATKVVIFSACRQLAGKPQQFLWATRMRGAANRVHLILSYRNTAPAAATSARINQSFIAGLVAGKTFIEAWRESHGRGLRPRWAALAFRSSIGDRMDHWVRDGSLPTEPAVDEDILYFDEDNRSGRVVRGVTPDFSVGMTMFAPGPTNGLPRLVGGDIVPPFSILRKNSVVNLNIAFMTDTFQDGDKIWLGALQVRPDYAGPFDIKTVIQFGGQSALISSGKVVVLGRLHDESAGYTADTYSDLYEFVVNRSAMPVGILDSTFSQLTIPLIIGSKPNTHLPIFYLMIRVERGTREFGIPTDLDATRGIRIANQAKLADEPQFCVFLSIDP